MNHYDDIARGMRAQFILLLLRPGQPDGYVRMASCSLDRAIEEARDWARAHQMPPGTELVLLDHDKVDSVWSEVIEAS